MFQMVMAITLGVMSQLFHRADPFDPYLAAFLVMSFIYSRESK